MDARPHITDVRRAVGRHDHVVDRTARDIREVGVLDNGSVRFDAQQSLRLHRDDE